jgi:hypothetical protein
MNELNNVSIKFKPGAYRLFRSLKYKVWLALSEYVDNSVQSYLSNKDRLRQINPGYQFKIDITYASDHIIVRDNAAGIDAKNIQRAFEPANIPDNNTGLNEFGMGMKTASIWLAQYWSVRTAAIGELEERFIEFDLQDVTDNDKEELPIQITPKELDTHFTEVTLQMLTDNGKNRQIEKLKKHITSIHRNLIRTGELELRFNESLLAYEDLKILKAPFYKDENGESIEWREEINYEVGKYKVKGFIAILDKMSTSLDNGFSLFRRGRVIEGSHDEKFRPKSLCGQVGSPRFKRIFGELELEGFEVSFDKGSFSNPEELEYFLEQVKNEMIKNKVNIFSQAEHFRLSKNKEQNSKVVEKAVESFNRSQQEKDEAPSEVFKDIVKVISSPETPEEHAVVDESNKMGEISETKVMLGKTFNLKIDFIDDRNIPHFYFIEMEEENSCNIVTCSINLGHPFFIKYSISDDSLPPLIQIIKSLVYAELTAPSKGTTKPGNVRINFNQFIRDL